VPRPARYPTDDMLDSAAQLLVEGGPPAVTMSAVARAVGAPSGSVYHRFPSRAALCGELWLRTEERFQGSLIGALASPADAPARCVAGAVGTVRWCRSSPVEAQVLLAGADALCRAEWPDDLTDRRSRLHRALSEAITQLMTASTANVDRLTAAIIDIPHAVVRRHLVAGQTIPPSAESIVEDCARALISAGR
jgi:AcrR family transcriptional regulator